MTVPVHAKVLFSNHGDRLLLDPFTSNNDVDPFTRRYGIKTHNYFQALVRKILHIFGLAQGIIETEIDGSKYYLNKGSLRKWCARHDIKLTSLKPLISLFKEAIAAEVERQEAEAEELKALQARQKADRLALNEKIKEFAINRIEEMSNECFNEDGSLKDNSPNPFRKPDEYFYNESCTYYHGTKLEAAEAIKEEGFNIYRPATNGSMGGAAVYLTHLESVAQGYSDMRPGSVLKCRVKRELKIARYEASNHVKINLVAQKYFNDHRQDINKDIQDIRESLPNNYWNTYMDQTQYQRLLEAHFVREVYLKAGFEGIYDSTIPYLALYNPDDDIEEIA